MLTENKRELRYNKKMIKMLDLQNPQSKNKLHIKTVTWQKDSHLLFDYEFTKNVIIEQFVISLQPSYVFFYRNNAKSQIHFVKKAQMIPHQVEGAQLMGCFQIVSRPDKKFRINFHDGHQFDYSLYKKERMGTEVSNSSGEYKKQSIYFIVRSLKDSEQESKGFILKTGHKIKFGRIQFNVAVIKENDKEIEAPNFFQYEETLTIEDKQYSEQQACKICLSNQQSQPNSFFCSPCSCVGSCSIVHFDCLFQWCKTKVKRAKVGKIEHYNFQKFECEICKKYFPRFIIRNGIKHDLLPIQKPEGSYLVLSSNSKLGQNSKSMIIIGYIEENVLKVGRNQTCDIRIVDISVSRQHASIEMRKGQFELYDSKSKFGTIVSEPNFYLDLEKVKRGIQVGRTVLTFQQMQKQKGSKFQKTPKN